MSIPQETDDEPLVWFVTWPTECRVAAFKTQEIAKDRAGEHGLVFEGSWEDVRFWERFFDCAAERYPLKVWPDYERGETFMQEVFSVVGLGEWPDERPKVWITVCFASGKKRTLLYLWDGSEDGALRALDYEFRNGGADLYDPTTSKRVRLYRDGVTSIEIAGF